MSTRTVPISLAIPAYSRVQELSELIRSVESQEVLPAEIIVCEDCSPMRLEIGQLVASFVSTFSTRGCILKYIENDNNLGYDGNVRKLLDQSTQEWTMLIGNDDLIMPFCFDVAEKFLLKYPDVKVVSRSFVRFFTDIENPIGISSLTTTDKIFKVGIDRPRVIFRSCGFVGGLIIKSDWAKGIGTNKYDGTLYYQIYLASMAFCQGGIGYISSTIVAGRAGNPPLFGSADPEKSVHTPGAYAPKGRAKMWRSVLEICSDVGSDHGLNLLDDIKRELTVRQSFHVFEMMVSANTDALNDLRNELKKLGLYSHPLPIFLYWSVRIFGDRSKYLFSFIRKIVQ